MKTLRSRTGQGTMEYILIAAAVLFLAGLLVKVMKGPATDRVNEVTQEMAKPAGG